ncbi:MAG TPA: hypothetical protein PK335_13590 [Draconibacterium sp.]|nr:hypothetical protein [Draconibacterium sp.]
MKKLILLTLMLALVAGSFNASAKVRKKDVIGEWKYEAPTAPYGFEKGTLAISDKDGELAGNLILLDGSSMKLESVKLEKDMLSFAINVQGAYVMGSLKVDGDIMSGVVNSPDGDLKLTAQKTKKK